MNAQTNPKVSVSVFRGTAGRHIQLKGEGFDSWHLMRDDETQEEAVSRLISESEARIARERLLISRCMGALDALCDEAYESAIARAENR